MKIQFSWWASNQDHHQSRWDVDWADGWELRRMIDNAIELRRLKLENKRLEDELAKKSSAGES